MAIATNAPQVHVGIAMEKEYGLADIAKATALATPAPAAEHAKDVAATHIATYAPIAMASVTIAKAGAILGNTVPTPTRMMIVTSPT